MARRGPRRRRLDTDGRGRHAPKGRGSQGPCRASIERFIRPPFRIGPIGLADLAPADRGGRGDRAAGAPPAVCPAGVSVDFSGAVPWAGSRTGRAKRVEAQGRRKQTGTKICRSLFEYTGNIRKCGMNKQFGGSKPGLGRGVQVPFGLHSPGGRGVDVRGCGNDSMPLIAGTVRIWRRRQLSRRDGPFKYLYNQ